MSARTIIWYLHCWVRVDIWWWYELTSLCCTSWHGHELTWVRVDIYCVVIDVSSYHHLILALLGTSWHHLWYELTSLVVRFDIRWWYELTWVRVDMGTSWHGYELTGIPNPYFVEEGTFRDVLSEAGDCCIRFTGQNQRFLTWRDFDPKVRKCP